jgi:hypothetical protein
MPSTTMNKKIEPISRPSSRCSTPTRRSSRIQKIVRPASVHPLPTPRASPSPSNSRPSTPRQSLSHNRTASTPMRAVYTYTTASPSSPVPTCQSPTVNWDCVSQVVSDQKILSTFEKPTTPEGSNTVAGYGRIITTTTTTTVTTTIATSEILHPGEMGYEASLARHRAIQEASQEEKQRIMNLYHQSREMSRGEVGLHQNFHQQHHQSVKPSRTVTSTA